MFELGATRSGASRGPARTLLLVGVVTMTAAWPALWVALISRWSGIAGLPFLVQWLVLAGAATGSCALARSNLGERTVRGLFVLCSVIAALALAWLAAFPGRLPFDADRFGDFARALTPATAVAGVVVPLVGGLVLVWLGGQIGTSSLDEHEAARFFVIGLAGLFSGLAVDALSSGGSALDGVMGLSCALFFSAALLTMPLAQVFAVRERSTTGSAKPAPLDRRWIPTVVGSVGAILLTALVLSAALSGVLFSALSTVVNWLPDLLGAIVLPIAYGLAILAEGVIWLVRRLFGAHAPRQLPVQSGIPKAPKAAHALEHHAHLPPDVQGALSIALVAVIVGVAGLLLARSIGRIGRMQDGSAFEEERESVWSWEAAKKDLSALFGRRHGNGLEDADRGKHPRTIREAYRRFLNRETDLGRPRLAADTPFEFVARLAAPPRDEEPDARALTAAYVRERYGREMVTGGDVDGALAAWAGIEAATSLAERKSQSTGRAKGNR